MYVCIRYACIYIYIYIYTVGGDKLILDPRRSWGPVLECRRISGRPAPGVPPGELAQDGAIRIFGVIRVLSDSRLLVNVLATRRKLLSLAEGELNHPPNIAKQTCYVRLNRSTNVSKYIAFLPPRKNKINILHRGLHCWVYKKKFNLMLVATAPTKYIVIFYQNDN